MRHIATLRQSAAHIPITSPAHCATMPNGPLLRPFAGKSPQDTTTDLTMNLVDKLCIGATIALFSLWALSAMSEIAQDFEHHLPVLGWILTVILAIAFGAHNS